MSYLPKTAERGFTLIEMSIVLVIIGLIVGGILKGQELIESSRQKNLMSQIDQLRSSTSAFLDRFKALPGDYANASTNIYSGFAAADNGDNNSIVGSLAADVAAILAADKETGENRSYFNHLAAANMLGGVAVVPAATTVSGFSGNGGLSPYPAAAYPNTGLMVTHGVHEGANTNGVSRRSLWLSVQLWNASTGSSADGYIAPARMLSLDTKYDDTLPYSGRIRSTFSGTGCGTNAATYVGTNVTPACIPLFDVLD